jgi:hypothetical protein
MTDVSAVPWVSENCKQRYEQWLKSTAPRGFAISDSGNCGSSSGTTVTNDLPPDPAERALTICEKMNRGQFQLYVASDLAITTAEDNAITINLIAAYADNTPANGMERFKLFEKSCSMPSYG